VKYKHGISTWKKIKLWPHPLAHSIGFIDPSFIKNRGINFIGGDGLGQHGDPWKL